MDPMQISDEEWKRRMTPLQYHVMREKGTEAPFSGALVESDAKGMYVCAACGNELFSSDTKFDSNSGWPSFYDAKDGAVEFHDDTSHDMTRTEVKCARCGSHLGHIFNDAPEQPTGQRYCINSVALDVKPPDPYHESTS